MTAGNDRAVRAFVDEIVAQERPTPRKERLGTATENERSYQAAVAADRRPRREARPRQEAGAWLVWTDMNDGPRPVVLGIYGSELEALRFAVNGPYTGAKVTRTPWGPLDLDKRGGW